MIDELAMSYHIDSSRVYATGLSNGGAMSYYLASQLSNRLAAIAPVGAPRPANPTAPRPLPVLHVHGTADSFVPIAGGFMNIPLPGGEYFSTFTVLAIDDVIDDWRESNGCVGEPVITQLPDLNTRDSSTVTLIRYEDGERYLTAAGDERSAEVLYYMIEGGGHTWPGGGMSALFGPTNRDINWGAEIWNFFSRHELPVVPLPGDYNQNGTVDAADYVVWRKNGGTQEDYNAWRANFGRTLGVASGSAGYGHRASGPGASAEPLQVAVPEPATFTLLIMAMVAHYARRRSTRGSWMPRFSKTTSPLALGCPT